MMLVIVMMMTMMAEAMRKEKKTSIKEVMKIGQNDLYKQNPI